jgi:hypothetical protein
MPYPERAIPEEVLVLQILQSCATLGPIASTWEPVGSLVESARMALAGEGGVSFGEVRTLVGAAERWGKLDPRLRHLYAAHSGEGAVQSALWVILLSKRPTTPTGAVYGTLRSLWVALYGYTPPIEMVPIYTRRRKNDPSRDR